MAYLFDTDAISESFRSRPLPGYLRWLGGIPREDQFTSAVCVGELYRGAYRSTHPDHHLANIRERVLPAITVLPFDVATARVFGRLLAELESMGRQLPDAHIQIAATALHHELTLVTGNVRHFSRIEGLRIGRALAEARAGRPRP